MSRPHPLGIVDNPEWADTQDRWNARYCDSIKPRPIPTPFERFLEKCLSLLQSKT